MLWFVPLSILWILNHLWGQVIDFYAVPLCGSALTRGGGLWVLLRVATEMTRLRARGGPGAWRGGRGGVACLWSMAGQWQDCGPSLTLAWTGGGLCAAGWGGAAGTGRCHVHSVLLPQRSQAYKSAHQQARQQRCEPSHSELDHLGEKH